MYNDEKIAEEVLDTGLEARVRMALAELEVLRCCRIYARDLVDLSDGALRVFLAQFGLIAQNVHRADGPGPDDNRIVILTHAELDGEQDYIGFASITPDTIEWMWASRFVATDGSPVPAFITVPSLSARSRR